MSLTGAYLTLDDLMALRYEARLRRRPPSRRMGTVESRQRGRGVDFDEVRQYRPGDDARHIDWRVTARKVDTHTKVFREEREHSTFLLIDQTRSMFFGSRERFKSVAAAEVATINIWRSFEADDRVGGAIVSPLGTTIVEPRKSLSAVTRLLNAIVAANRSLTTAAPPGDWRIAVETTRQFMQRGHPIVVISDFADPSGPETIATSNLANRRSEFIFIKDPLERVLPNRGMYAVADGNERIDFDATSDKFRADFADSFDDRRERVASLAENAAIRFAEVETYDAMVTAAPERSGFFRR